MKHILAFCKREASILLFLFLLLLFCFLSYYDYQKDFLAGRNCTWWMASLSFATRILTFSLLLLSAAKSRIVAYGIMLPLLLLYSIIAVVSCIFSHYSTDSFVFMILQTNWNEFVTVTPAYLFVAVPCLTLFYIFTINLYRAKTVFTQIPAKWVIPFFFLFSLGISYGLFRATLAYPHTLSHLVYDDSPEPNSNYRQHLANHLFSEYKHQTFLMGAYSPFHRFTSLIYSHSLYYWRHPEQLLSSASLDSSKSSEFRNEIIILYVGESYRADHASWNGYYRQTLPKLSKIKAEGKHLLLNFPLFSSFATSTYQSLYGILTDAHESKRKASYDSFLGILKKQGICSAVVSRGDNWPNSYQFKPVLNSSDHIFVLRGDVSNDDFVKKLEAIIDKNSTSPTFIFIKDVLGHYPYGHEPQFSVFSGSSRREIDNYDNTLLQVDDILSKTIELLEDKKAVMIYVSDHGEFLGENGKWLHLGELSDKSLRHIFAFAWISDKYRNAHKDITNSFLNKMETPLSHDHLYHTIPSMFGINFSTQDAQLNISK